MNYKNYKQKSINKKAIRKLMETIHNGNWTYREHKRIAEQAAGRSATPERLFETFQWMSNYLKDNGLIDEAIDPESKAYSYDMELAIEMRYVGISNHMTFFQLVTLVDGERLVIDATEAHVNDIVYLIRQLFPTSTLTPGTDLTMRGENELLVVHQEVGLEAWGTFALGRGKVDQVSALDCYEMVQQYLNKNMTYVDALKQYQIEMNKIDGVKNFQITDLWFTGQLDALRFTVSFPGY